MAEDPYKVGHYSKAVESEETKLRNMSSREVLRYVDRSNPEVKRLAGMLEQLSPSRIDTLT